MKYIIFLTCFLIGTVIANISDLPGIANLPLGGISEESGKKFVQDKCKNQTGDDKAFDKILESRESFQNCIKDLNINASVINDEIEKAKPTGDLDVVFGKYCRKIPSAITCIKDFYKTLEPCLSQTEKDGAKTMYNVTLTMKDFLCYKDGDRMALFIAEGGVECVTSHKDGIQECFKQTFGEKMPTEVPNMEDQCGKLASLQTCVVRDLEQCKEKTPANLIEALFRYVRNILSCPKIKTK